ncbi:MAG: AAA family ATPase [Pseudomonadota bacterium]
MSDRPVWLRALEDPARYPHAVERVEVIETHISWVVLAGDRAYKFKKPVNLGFVDFSALHLRRYYCREELRRNRPLAGDLYEAVIALCGEPEDPALGPDEDGVEAFEYGVRMRRFEESQRLDHLLEAGDLAPAELEDFTTRLAAYHAGTAVADNDTTWGTPEAVTAPARENLTTLRRTVNPDDAGYPHLRAVTSWTEQAHHRLAPLFAQRRAAGAVRECHGDLHLGNMARVDGRVIAFDCIEFNPAFYWIDTMNEVAFLAMDTRDRGRPDLGRRALNRYLEQTGDFAGMAVFDYYQVYRALVRAKVAAIRVDQEEGEAADAARAEMEEYLGLADALTRPRQPWLAITHGLSGSGKSHASGALIAATDAIRLRSDVERKRLHGLPPDAETDAGMDAGIYTAAASERTYDHLLARAEELLDAGWPVVVDATFLTAKRREPFRALARRRGWPFAILDLEAPEAVLRERIAARAAAGGDASEADTSVLEAQLKRREQPTGEEERDVVRLDATQPVDGEALVRRVVPPGPDTG